MQEICPVCKTVIQTVIKIIYDCNGEPRMSVSKNICKCGHAGN